MSGIHQRFVSTVRDPHGGTHDDHDKRLQGGACEADRVLIDRDQQRKENYMAEICFKVPGLTEGEGIKAVTGQVRQIDGVSGVEIDVHTRWVVITGERIDTDAVRQAVRRAGY